MDLRGIPCPRNTSMAMIKLSTMDSGEILEVWLDDGEPIQNVPPALRLEGYDLILQERAEAGHWRLQIKGI